MMVVVCFEEAPKHCAVAMLVREEQTIAKRTSMRNNTFRKSRVGAIFHENLAVTGDEID
jgi:hypothetical protein